MAAIYLDIPADDGERGIGDKGERRCGVYSSGCSFYGSPSFMER